MAQKTTTPEIQWVGPNNLAEVMETRAPELVLHQPAYGRFNRSAHDLLKAAAEKVGLASFETALVTGARNKGLLVKAAPVGTDNATPLKLHRKNMTINLAIACKYFKLPMASHNINLAVPVALVEDPACGWCISLDFTAARQRVVKRQHDRKARTIDRKRVKAEKELHQAEVAAAILDLGTGKKS